MSPSELFEHDWLHMIQGRRCAPGHPTCLQATPGTTIDFFIPHSSLVGDVPFQVAVQSDAALWPHQPVLLHLPRDRLQLKKRELKQQRGFPKVAAP
eukprot:5158264-Pyramimonas_sp.AAC.1